MKIQLKTTVDVPKVPNYLRTSDGNYVPLCAVTDDGLREIAAQWTAALLARSKEQSKNPVHGRDAEQLKMSHELLSKTQ